MLNFIFQYRIILCKNKWVATDAKGDIIMDGLLVLCIIGMICFYGILFWQMFGD